MLGNHELSQGSISCFRHVNLGDYVNIQGKSTKFRF